MKSRWSFVFLSFLCIFGLAASPVQPVLSAASPDDFSCAAVSEIPQSECESLVALYNGTNGPAWTNQSNWLVTNTPSDWYGLWVLDGHVLQISLQNNNLSGSIPAGLQNFSYLTRLYLGENQLLEEIPAQLANLASLQVLDLSSNQITGSIPPALGNLANLIALWLDNNQLSGMIPSELGNLAALQELHLHSNQLSGSIPPQLGSLSSLLYTYLSQNQLSGSIPPQLGSLSNLVSLGLDRNQLTGSIPPELGNLNQLQYLSLSQNQLTGSIPPELGNLSALTMLILNYNQLSGSIPSQLGSLSNLNSLYLGYNQLSGSIPSQLGNLSNLISMHLGANSLSGPLPSSLGSLANLHYLYLNFNQLSGPIPPQLGNLVNLVELWLSSNQFSGSIPAALGALSAVRDFRLSDNQLTGSVPAELGSLSELRYLIINSNPLTGRLPSTFTNLGKLSYFMFYDTSLCEPQDSAFQAWKAGVASWDGSGIQCSDSVFSVSGRVINSVGSPVAGATISSTSGHTAQTGSDGNYTLAGLPPGTYTLTPSLPGAYRFEPESRSVTVSNSNLSGMNFTFSRPPIILLPGIMGSRLYNNPLTSVACLLRPRGEIWLNLGAFLLNPDTLYLKPDSPAPVNACDRIYPQGIMDSGQFDSYSGFIAEMRNSGYTVYPFSSDWRLSLEDSAAKLDTFINSLHVGKVVLVAHSMGGLLARTYVDNASRAAKVSMAISVGSPYWGSPALALVMRTGLLPTLTKIPLTDRYLALPAAAEIIRNSPGSMQLLPSEAYFEQVGSGYYQNDNQVLSTYAATKDFFAAAPGKRGTQNGALIEAARLYHAKVDRLTTAELNGVNYYSLAANHLPTRSLIREYPCSFLLLPDTCFEEMRYLPGDDTVPYVSAAVPGEIDPSRVITFAKGEVNSGHGGLIQDPAVIAAIKNLLVGNPPKASLQSADGAMLGSGAGFIQVAVWGDAEVSATDSLNHFTGLDPAGVETNQIPGATFTRYENETVIVLPAGQVYTLTIQQHSEFALLAKVTELQQEDAGETLLPNQRAVFVNLPSSPGGTAELSLDLSAGLASLQWMLDQDNDGTPEQMVAPDSVLNSSELLDVTMPETSITLTGTRSPAGVYSGLVSVEIAAADAGTGLSATVYSLNGGRTWQAYTGPFQINAEDVSFIYAFATDFAGNREYPYTYQPLGFRSYLPIGLTP